jgi:hypothetical protein
MIQKRVAALGIMAILCGGRIAGFGQDGDERRQLLMTREAVWRSWFADDVATLKQLVPPGTIVISAGEPQWKHQAEVLQTAADFHAQGGKLLRLEFPKTEIQRFDDVAILYSAYIVETEMKGQHSVISGRATEVFVQHDGHWTNPGWHTDSEK